MGFDLCKDQMARCLHGVNVGHLNLEESKDEAKEDRINVGTTLEMNLEDEAKENGANVSDIPLAILLKVPDDG